MLLMLVSIVQGYGFGLLIEKHRGQKASKVFLTLSILVSLGLLGYFKYADFFLSSVNAVTGLSLPLLKLSLPIGISFYTFQVLSYVIDVYRGETAAQRNFIDLAAYVSLFPSSSRGRSCAIPMSPQSSKAARTASPPRRRACAALRSALPRKFCSPTSSAHSRAPINRRRTRASSSSGSTRSRFCSRCTSTFRVTVTWPSASGGCWASTSLKTSTTPIFQRASRSSGAGGTCRLARGSATTSISLSAAAGRARRVSC